MEFQNNKTMLLIITGLVVALAVVLSFKIPLPTEKPEPLPIEQPEKYQPVQSQGAPRRNAYGRSKVLTVNKSNYVNGDEAVLFALKTACRENVARINTSVEMWNIMNGEWPNHNLSDIGRDVDYFPSGVPVCPLDGTAYRLDPQTHRVAGHLHQDILAPIMLERDAYKRAKKAKKPKKEKRYDSPEDANRGFGNDDRIGEQTPGGGHEQTPAAPAKKSK